MAPAKFWMPIINTRSTPMSNFFDQFDTKTAAETGHEFNVLKPDGDESDLFITVLGSDSTTATKLKERYDRNRLRQMAKSGGGNRAADMIYESAKTQDVELLAACTLSWRLGNGDEMPFPATDKEQLEQFYQKYPSIADQVRAVIGDRSLFIRK